MPMVKSIHLCNCPYITHVLFWPLFLVHIWMMFFKGTLGATVKLLSCLEVTGSCRENNLLQCRVNLHTINPSPVSRISESFLLAPPLYEWCFWKVFYLNVFSQGYSDFDDSKRIQLQAIVHHLFWPSNFEQISKAHYGKKQSDQNI